MLFRPESVVPDSTALHAARGPMRRTWEALALDPSSSVALQLAEAGTILALQNLVPIDGPGGDFLQLHLQNQIVCQAVGHAESYGHLLSMTCFQRFPSMTVSV